MVHDGSGQWCLGPFFVRVDTAFPVCRSGHRGDSFSAFSARIRDKIGGGAEYRPQADAFR